MTGALLLLLSALPAPRWVPTLDQSFDGPRGQAPDAKVWARDVGPARTNNELQAYTDGADNASLDGKGHLVIEARKEEREGRHYTSARLKTQGTFAQRYGRMEARMMLPQGQGIWPAFWMLGADIDKVGWPACGEIDAMEFIGREPKTAYGTLHGPGYSGGDGIQGKTLSDTLSTAFHTYGVEWTPRKIVWTFDGKPYHKVEAKDVAPRGWPFEKPQFLILNLAVGGEWPRNPDATTVFPQRLTVDWVRVWKDADLKVDETAIARDAEALKSYRDPGPQKVPGVVKLSDYVDAHDSDAVNEGGAYRTDGVDLGQAGPAEAPFSIGWTKAGEWLDYDLDVARAGDYKAELLAASEPAGGTILLSVDGKPFATVSVPGTGGWTAWRALPAGVARLTAGRHRLKVLMRTAGPGGSVGNVAMIRFTR